MSGKDSERGAVKKRQPTTKISREAVLKRLRGSLVCCLEITQPNGATQVLELTTEPMVIGRNPESSLCLPHDDVSWEHAVIEYRNEEYFVRDLDSTNGTFLNQVKIVESVLREHDHIAIADVSLVFYDRGNPLV